MAKSQEPATVPLTAVTPPRKRRGRKLLAFAVIVFVGLAALVWFAPAIIAQTSLRDSILRTATAKVNGTVTVGGLSLGWLQPIELTDVRLTDPDGREVLNSPTIRTSNTLLDLALNRNEIGTITIDRPTLTVVCGDRTNLEDVLARILTGEAEKSDRSAITIEVTGGKLLLAEKGGTPAPVLDSVAATLTVPRESDKSVSVTVRVDASEPVNPGRMDATLDIGPTVGIVAKADRFPLDGFGPLVRRFAPGTQLGGRATSDLNLKLGQTTTVTGRAEVSGLDVSSPLFGPDRVRLARATVLPCNVTIAGNMITVGEGTELDCDVGKVTASGEFSASDSPEKLLSRHGLKATADVDLAKLAALIPRLLHVREGTQITSGHVKAKIDSATSPRGVGWKGQVETTVLRGTRGNQAIAWEHPFLVRFDAHFRPDGLPEFDDLQCLSEFASLRAQGTVSEFVAGANLNLSKLTAHLGEFIDFGGVHLAGTGSLTAKLIPGVDGGSSGLNANLTLTDFVYQDSLGHKLEEPNLTLAVNAIGKFVPTGPVSVNDARCQIIAGGDQLIATILSPVADARTAHTGKVRLQLLGDMARWRERTRPFGGLPPEVAISGMGRIDGQVDFAADTVQCPKLAVEIKQLGFRGFGLTLAEEQPVLYESGLSLDRNTGTVELTHVQLQSATVGASARTIHAAPLPNNGGWGAKGTVAITANVGRVTHAIGLAADVTGLANGQGHFDIGAGGVIGFDGNVTAENLRFGPPDKPTWVEPKVKLTTTGAWDPAADGVRLDKMHLERDGLMADARGSATKLSSPAAAVDVSGTLAYDLAKLEPQLRTYLGPGAKAVGNEVKPFKLSGRLGNGGRDLAVAVGRADHRFDQLSGSAAVGWQEVRAYGFAVGPAELTAGLDKGTINFSPVKATFGGGTVSVTPKLQLDSGYDLSFAPGRVVTNAKLTPAACANAVGFVLPPLANAAEVEGLISLDLDKNTIPLADPAKMNLRGTVQVHNATVSAGPLISEIATALQAKNTSFTLTQEQAVKFWVENGRVHHESFKMMFEQTAVTTSGSVGLDGTVALFVDVQVPPKLVQLIKDATVRETVSKQTIRIPVGGTLAKPKLDPRGYQTAVQKMMTRDAAGGLLKLGQDRLFQELEKKFKPPEKK